MSLELAEAKLAHLEAVGPHDVKVCETCHLYDRLAAAEEALRVARRHLSQDHACGSQRRGSHAKVWAYEIETPNTAFRGQTAEGESK